MYSEIRSEQCWRRLLLQSSLCFSFREARARGLTWPLGWVGCWEPETPTSQRGEIKNRLSPIIFLVVALSLAHNNWVRISLNGNNEIDECLISAVDFSVTLRDSWVGWRGCASFSAVAAASAAEAVSMSMLILIRSTDWKALESLLSIDVISLLAS